MRSSRISGANGRCSRTSSSNTGRIVHLKKSSDLGDGLGIETLLLLPAISFHSPTLVQGLQHLRLVLGDVLESVGTVLGGGCLIAHAAICLGNLASHLRAA
jgi:hypothetical protein